LGLPVLARDYITIQVKKKSLALANRWLRRLNEASVTRCKALRLTLPEGWLMTRVQLAAIAVLGVWLGVTLFMWMAASQSFRTVDAVLSRPAVRFSDATRSLDSETARHLVRYVASEINRAYFRRYNLAQLALGTILLALLLVQAGRDRTSIVLAGIMLGLVLVLTVVITPAIVKLGRELDFVARMPPPPGIGHFRLLHGAYTGFDAVKLLTGIGLLVRWIIKA
jgi:hypothetical protein